MHPVLKGENMRITVSAIAALALVASAAWADAPPAEPVKPETVSASPVPDNPPVAIRPAPQASIVKPRESGPEQPLCTGE